LAVDQRVWEALTSAPRRISQLLSNAPGLAALRRLADAGWATIAAFTPSDALHVLGRQQGWNGEAAELGARLLAMEERNIRGVREALSASAFCERTVEHVIRESARIVAATALAHDPGLEAQQGSWGLLGDRLIDEVVAGRPFAALVRTGISLATPLVAIGAPVAAYYPEVARRLNCALTVPPHAAVCNAVGAVAGVVSQTVDVLVNQPALGVFRVHDPAGGRDFRTAEPAIDYARELSQRLALEAARRAGAADPHVESALIEHRAHMGATDYLAEALVRSTATGRPLAGHPRSEA
jgi:N-methylhydantoinase A/oxoprolinase/acetone carboxylase beta subunit